MKLQIREAGVSIGELRQALVDWLGHQTHISGSLVRQGDTLFITTRAGAGAQTVSGAANDVDALIAKAAETVLDATDPGAYADYLRGHRRVAEAIPIYRTLTVRGSPRDRAWAYLGWSDALRVAPADPSPARNIQISLGLLREAARLDPNLWLVWENIGDAQQFVLQDSEAALASRRRTMRATDFGGYQCGSGALFHPRGPDLPRRIPRRLLRGPQDRDRGGRRSVGPRPGLRGGGPGGLRAVHVHDNGLSRAWTQRALDRSTADPVRRDQRLNRLRYWRLMNVDDWNGAADSIALANGMTATVSNAYWSALGEIALARAGRLAGARAIDADLPANCYICEIASGVLANAAGDVAGSERFFAEAIRFGPSLPKAPIFAGEARLGRGDLDGAIAMFKLANARGPHYADALELWGEALMRKGDAAAAVAKFAEADKYAPHWGRNHLRAGDRPLPSSARSRTPRPSSASPRPWRSPPPTAPSCPRPSPAGTPG